MSVFTRNANPGRTQEDSGINKNDSILLKCANLKSKSLHGNCCDPPDQKVMESKQNCEGKEILELTSHQEELDWWDLETMTEIYDDDDDDQFDWELLIERYLSPEPDLSSGPLLSSTKLDDLSQTIQEDQESQEEQEDQEEQELQEEQEEKEEQEEQDNQEDQEDDDQLVVRGMTSLDDEIADILTDWSFDVERRWDREPSATEYLV